jgi:hypothetical protein
MEIGKRQALSQAFSKSLNSVGNIYLFNVTMLLLYYFRGNIFVVNMETIVNTDSIINAVQNEPNIWDTNRNASEEDKDLAWKRIADSFSLQDGEQLRHTSMSCVNVRVRVRVPAIATISAPKLAQIKVVHAAPTTMSSSIFYYKDQIKGQAGSGQV